MPNDKEQCPKRGANLVAWRETLHEEHRCDGLYHIGPGKCLVAYDKDHYGVTYLNIDEDERHFVPLSSKRELLLLNEAIGEIVRGW